MNIIRTVCITGILMMVIAATVMNCSAEGYKSAAQIMEYAAKLDNQGEKKRAIKMYQTIIDKYPDSKQAKMAQSRIGVLEGRVNEEADAAEQRRSEKEYERKQANVCNHLYIGKSAEVDTLGGWGLVRGVITGVSTSRGIASIRDSASGDVREFSCSSIR